MWFDIIGVTLGFVSSVIFSAGLIKPKEQIRDENTTYFNANFIRSMLPWGAALT